jgi:hypothetical protein
MVNDMATLRQLLKNGELGPIHAGMTQPEVIALLGPPMDESVSRHPQGFKYGGLQLTFLSRSRNTDRVLAHIGLYFRPCPEPIPASTQLEDFNATPETTMAEVQQFLKKLGLSEYAVVEGEDANYLIMPSSARITFEGQKLHSIHYAAPRSGSARKQISVSVSTDTWDQLKALARQSNRKVAELCAEWIAERANQLETEKDRQIA